ncbi:MAG: hypothetical protein QGH40_03165, partial [bacterium]|nr:hypothetical protein [bacterium]
TGRLQENTEPTEKKTGQSHQEDNVNRVAITQKLKNTQTLITFCRERNIALIIMTPPLTSFGARHLVGPPVEAVARLAVSQNVPVIDLFTIFPDLERENGLTLESEGNRQKLVKNTNGEAQVLIETERSPEYQISPDIFRFIYRHNLKQTTVIDQLHPTPKGHEIIATLIHKKLLEMKVLR